MRIGIYLPEDLIDEAKKHCQETGKTVSGMCRVGIQKQLGVEKNE